MNVQPAAAAVSAIAAAIGEPSRARMLYSLVDGRARTTTELAATADVTAATASVHLQRLKMQKLVRVFEQGKHRYYTLAGNEVATALESLSVLAGGRGDAFISHTPHRLRHARTCYDHLAGTLGVLLHDRLVDGQWIDGSADGDYDVTAAGAKNFAGIGIDVDAARGLRRRFAFACLDWSERRPHLGGALGAALLTALFRRHWVSRELDSRVLSITSAGRREMTHRFGLDPIAFEVNASAARERAPQSSRRA
jgi:DNA-binding transcriptional ArsR family regulator